MHGYTLRYLILCLVLLATALGGHLTAGGRPAPALVPDWENLPLSLSGWQGRRAPVDPEVAKYLEAQAMVRLVYEKAGQTLFFSAVYGTQWRSLHSPAGCFPSQGWQTVDRRDVSIEAGPGTPHPGPLHAEQLLVKQQDKYLLVTYLYAHQGGTTSSWVEQCLKVAQTGMQSGGIVLILEGPCRPESRHRVHKAEAELLRFLYPELVRMWYRG